MPRKVKDLLKRIKKTDGNLWHKKDRTDNLSILQNRDALQFQGIKTVMTFH